MFSTQSTVTAPLKVNVLSVIEVYFTIGAADEKDKLVSFSPLMG